MDTHSTRPEVSDLKWYIVRQHILFDFGGKDFEKYTKNINITTQISISCLYKIIIRLFKHYNYPFEQISIKIKKERVSKIHFAIKDIKSKVLLLFKEIEECSYWKLGESKYIQALMQQCNVSSCKYIYFMSDYAYLQIINHNDDESDSRRDQNIYSIKWFWETYFGKDEYERFNISLRKFI